MLVGYDSTGTTNGSLLVSTIIDCTGGGGGGGAGAGAGWEVWLKFRNIIGAWVPPQPWGGRTFTGAEYGSGAAIFWNGGCSWKTGTFPGPTLEYGGGWVFPFIIFSVKLTINLVFRVVTVFLGDLIFTDV